MNLESINIYLKDLNTNKAVMVLITILLALYASLFVNSLSNFMINLFSNNVFKFIIFCIIGLISYSNQTIGIMLAIAVLITLQVILNINLQNQIKIEKFSPMDLYTLNYNHEDYLQNPLQMQNNLNPTITNLNLNLENPDQIYKNMIKKGKVLLDDSLEIQKDLELTPDNREKYIYDITKRDGDVLIQSGLNRLQVSNQGEYNVNQNNLTENNNLIKFVKFDKLIGDYKNDPAILQAFNELQNNFKILQTSLINKKDFDSQLEIVYKNEIDLLKLIYIVKKHKICAKKIKNIEIIFNKNKQHNEKDNNRLFHITELVELLS